MKAQKKCFPTRINCSSHSFLFQIHLCTRRWRNNWKTLNLVMAMGRLLPEPHVSKLLCIWTWALRSYDLKYRLWHRLVLLRPHLPRWLRPTLQRRTWDSNLIWFFRKSTSTSLDIVLFKCRIPNLASKWRLLALAWMQRPVPTYLYSHIRYILRPAFTRSFAPGSCYHHLPSRKERSCWRRYRS